MSFGSTPLGGGPLGGRPPSPPATVPVTSTLARATLRLEALLGTAVERVTVNGETRVTVSGGSRTLVGSGAGTAWVDLTRDVMMAAGVQWRRGIGGAGPLDRVADTGTLAFSLWNDATNSGGLRGYYSPRHTNVRPGWEIGVPVRLIAEYEGDDYPLWRGVLSSIIPVSGVKGARSVLCTCVDAMDLWAESPVNGVSRVEDGAIDALVQAISDGASAPLWIVDPDDGALASLATSSDRLPYAFIDVGGGQYALSLLQNVMQSALGYAYVAKDGTFTTENRHARAERSSVLTLEGDVTAGAEGNVQVPSSLTGVANRIRATVHPVTLGASNNTVLYRQAGQIFVDPGQTLDVWGTYTDPTNTVKLLGGDEQIVPIEAGVDYFANSEPDGSGDDLTPEIAIVTSAFVTSVKFSITNAGSQRAYLVNGSGEPFLQIRGMTLADDGPLTVESTPSDQPYGVRTAEIDLPYLDDVNFGTSYANYLRLQYESPVQIEAVVVNPQLSGVLMSAALALEIGDVITVSEEMTGLDNVEAYVQSISGQMRDNFWFTFTLGLAPRGITEGTPWKAGVVGRSEAGVSTLAGF